MLTPEREAEIRVIAATKGYAKRPEWWDAAVEDLLAELDRLRAENAVWGREALLSRERRGLRQEGVLLASSSTSVIRYE